MPDEDPAPEIFPPDAYGARGSGGVGSSDCLSRIAQDDIGIDGLRSEVCVELITVAAVRPAEIDRATRKKGSRPCRRQKVRLPASTVPLIVIVPAASPVAPFPKFNASVLSLS